MTHRWILIGLMLVNATLAHAQVTQQWVAQGTPDSLDVGGGIVTDGSQVYVTGNSRQHCSPLCNVDFATEAYDAMTGTTLWTVPLGGFIAMDAANGRVFVAWSSGTNHGTNAYDGATGTLLWTAPYTGRLVVDGNGTVFLAWNGNNMVALDGSTGTPLWTGPNVTIALRGIAVDGLGRVYIVGASNGDFATVAYDAATGTQLWLARYHAGPTNYNSNPTAITVDGQGHVYVAGRTTYSNGQDINVSFAATVAYDGTTGTQLWAASYGPDGTYTTGNGIAADGSGAVFMAGSFIYGPGASDYTIVAYDAATGAELWETQPDHGYASPIAVDGRGSVYVTGQVPSADGERFESATVALDATTGLSLWEVRYGSPAANYAAGSIAVDSLNRVYITGGADPVSALSATTVAYSQP